MIRIYGELYMESRGGTSDRRCMHHVRIIYVNAVSKIIIRQNKKTDFFLGGESVFFI